MTHYISNIMLASLCSSTLTVCVRLTRRVELVALPSSIYRASERWTIVNFGERVRQASLPLELKSEPIQMILADDNILDYNIYLIVYAGNGDGTFIELGQSYTSKLSVFYIVDYWIENGRSDRLSRQRKSNQAVSINTQLPCSNATLISEFLHVVAGMPTYVIWRRYTTLDALYALAGDGVINLCVEMTAMYDVREANEIVSGKQQQLLALYNNPSFCDATIRVRDTTYKVSIA